MMGNRLQEAIQKVRINRRAAHRYTAVLVVLALMTTIAVNWRLHQVGTALTTDSEYTCGYEEHVHTDECYTEELICGYEEGEPERIDEAFGVDAEPDAGSEPEAEPVVPEEAEAAPEPEEPAVEVHHHTADCYREVTELTCEEEEHTHGEYCYDQETGELLCTQEEHTHDDSCYTTKEELVCGYEEGEEIPSESADTAFEAENSAASTSDEAEPTEDAVVVPSDDLVISQAPVHHHTEACYEKVLTCTIPEHEHTLACLADTNADVETEDDWEQQSEDLSTFWNDALVEIAQKQLGYTESAKNFTVDEGLGETLADAHHYTRYGDWYGNPYGEWDVMFVAFCQHYAGIPKDVIPQCAGLFQLRTELETAHPEYLSDGADKATPGDIVLYYNTDGEETIGIVTGADADTLTVISGAVNGAVAEVTVDLTDVTNTISVLDAYEAAYGDTLPDDDVTDDMVENPSLYVADASGYDPDKAVDLKELCKDNEAKLTVKIEIVDKNTGNWIPLPEGYKVTENDSVRFEVHFEAKAGDFVDNKGNTINSAYYQFEDLGLFKDLTGQTIKYKNADGGLYSVTQDGLVKLVWNDQTIDLTKDFSVDFDLEATVSMSGSEDEKVIKFPGSSDTLTIRKKSDAQITKKGSDFVKSDTNGSYIEFELEVTTENGTLTKVDLEDVINNWNQIKGKYDKDSFEVTGPNGTVTLTDANLKIDNTMESNGELKQNFKITGLPALKAGEKYTVKYKYRVNDDSNLDGYFKNTAKVEYDGKSKEDYFQKTYDKNLSKTGSYNSATERTTWTVILRNQNKKDLNGYSVKDTLKNPNAKIIGDVRVRYGDAENNISNDYATINADGQNGFEYTFSKSPTNAAFYKFEYETDGKSGDQNEFDIFDPDKNKTDGVTGGSSGNTRDNYFGKAPGNQTLTPSEGDGTRTVLKWWATYRTDENYTATSYELTDTFLAPTNSEGKTLENENYAILGELKQQLQDRITVYLTDTGTEQSRAVAESKKVKFTYTFFSDRNCQNEVTDETAQVCSFKVKVDWSQADCKVYQINLCKEGTPYTTYVDTTQMGDYKQWSIENALSYDATHKCSGKYTYEKPKEPDKSPSLKKFSGTSAFWFSQNAEIDYNNKDNEKNIDHMFWYKLWLENASGNEFTVLDELPAGVTYTGNYVVGLSNDVSENAGRSSLVALAKQPASWDPNTPLDNWTPSEYVEVVESGRTLQFKFKDMENVPLDQYKGVMILFQVKIDDSVWEDAKHVESLYTNSAWWGECSADTTTRIKRNEEYVDKTGKQDQNPLGGDINKVTYTVTINKDAKKLLPNDSYLELVDRFTVPEGVLAELDPNSVKLTEKATGADATDKLYSFNTSSNPVGAKTEYVINFQVKYEAENPKAYLLTYTYTIDTSNTKATDSIFTLENSIEMFSKVKNANNVQYKKISGSASVRQDHLDILTVVKVQKDLVNVTLQGAKFDLYQYEPTSGDWTKVNNTDLVTDANGKLTFATLDNQGANVTIGYKKLYKLVETTAPSGYVKNDKAYYFIMMPKDETDQNTVYRAATNEDSVVGGMTADEKDSILYVLHNDYPTLQIENASSKIFVEKNWQDENGKPLSDADKPDNITVHLYRYSKTGSWPQNKDASFNKTLTLSKTNNWRGEFTGLEEGYYYVIEEESLAGYSVTYTRQDGTQGNQGLESGDKITITNQKKTTWLKVEKDWKDSDGRPLLENLPESITFVLYNAQNQEVARKTATSHENWACTFDKLNEDEYYYVVEEGPSGYTVTYSNGDTKVQPGATITVTNTKTVDAGYELPSTGGAGTTKYTMAGILLMGAALVYGFIQKRKCGRRTGE